VVPILLRRYGDAALANLAVSAEARSRDREWIEAIFAREVLPRIAGGPGEASADGAALSALPPAALRRALGVMAERAGRGSLTRRELFALEALVRGGAPFRFQAGRRVDFRGRRGVISARPCSGESL